MSQFGFSTTMLDPTDVQGQPTPHNLDRFPVLLPQGGAQVNIPNALVVSADYRISGTLGETLLLCGLAPTFAASIAASREHLAAGNLSMVLCQDHLPDGKYADILQLNQRVKSNAPVIVVSPTGDWQDYFAAIDLGAHDFLAYPLIRGELQRVIRSYFAECREQRALAVSLF